MIRMIKVALAESVILPRFTMRDGDTWELRPDRLTKDGFALGGGFIKNNQFKVIGVIYKK